MTALQLLVSCYLEITFHIPVTPSPDDGAADRREILNLPIDHEVHRLAVVILRISFEVDRPRFWIGARLERRFR